MRTLTSPSAGQTVVDELKVYEGGLGTDNAAAAATAINAVLLSSLGQANGVANLDEDGLIYPEHIPDDGVALIGITGPTNVNMGGSGVYTITNYDMFTTYDVVAISGTVSRVKDTITYNAPAAAGNGGFKINGKTCSVVINGPKPNSPTLAVVDGQGTNNKALVTLTGSAFQMNFGANTHLNTDWEISTSNTFASIAFSSYANATNKTTINFDGLNLSTTYYFRVRYRDNQNNVSDWSSTQSLTTKTTYTLSTEQAKLVESPLENGITGILVGMSGNGDRAFVRCGSGSFASSIIIFRRSGTSWVQEQKITDSTINFGTTFDIDSTGTRLVVGCPVNGTSAGNNVKIYVRSGTTWGVEQQIDGVFNATYGNDGIGYHVAIDGLGVRIGLYSNGSTAGSTNGSVRIYIRSGSTWTMEQEVSCSTTGGNQSFGYGISFDYNGSRFVSKTFNYGRIFVFVRSGSTWTEEQLITVSYNFNAQNNLSMDANGTRFAIGGPGVTTGGVQSGAVYIYVRSGSTWTQEQELSATDKAANDNFGNSLAISDDGIKIVIGATYADPSGLSNAGAAYVFIRNGSTWTQEAKLTASDKFANQLYGYSVTISNDRQYALIGSNTQTGNNKGAYVYTS